MTKEEAISKVIKLRNQAKGTSSSNEASTARKLADELAAKWHLTEDDLSASAKVTAFDELLVELGALAARKELPPSVAEAIGMLKKNMTGREKADALEKVVAAVRLGALLFGRKHMGPARDVVEKTLRKHDVVA